MSARHVALKVLQRVEEGSYVNLALDGECQRAKLSPLDRRLTSALVYGVLKGRARLDHALSAYAPRGLDKLDARVRDLLRLGAVQILDLRTPAHAAVDETVDSVRRLRGEKLAGFANALLRRLSRDGMPPPPTQPVAAISVRTGAPAWVVEAAIARLGIGEADALLQAESQPAPLWLRENPLRTHELLARLADELGNAKAIETSSLLPGAIAVRGADGIFDAKAYVEGLCTAQDLGAQLVGALLDPQPGERVLDACAGVGGKSTQLAERMRNEGRVVALDLSERKLDIGADHARRLGLTIIEPVTSDLTKAKLDTFDRVLLDAPCSGLGVARRHPEIRLRRDAAKIAELAALQARLVDAAAKLCRIGGVLVYAVCTYTDEEGPAQANAFLARHPGFERDPSAPIPSSLRDRGEPGELRTWPHRDDADAFFAARFKRVR